MTTYPVAGNYNILFNPPFSGVLMPFPVPPVPASFFPMSMMPFSPAPLLPPTAVPPLPAFAFGNKTRGQGQDAYKEQNVCRDAVQDDENQRDADSHPPAHVTTFPPFFVLVPATGPFLPPLQPQLVLMPHVVDKWPKTVAREDQELVSVRRSENVCHVFFCLISDSASSFIISSSAKRLVVMFAANPSIA